MKIIIEIDREPKTGPELAKELNILAECASKFHSAYETYVGLENSDKMTVAGEFVRYKGFEPA